ncbi:hypothetical protein K438DRAFT_1909026 [Mycena galopus ATCC 62051]|nr:hypothetical protein K438DRAFT_1909026 [Mycena galopus ATCC 62051]
MANPRLPSYTSYGEPRESFGRSPSYSAEPGLHEQRLAVDTRLLPRPTGNFIKSSKHGDVTLRLAAQEENVDLPVYGSGSVVEGTVELSKPEKVDSVEVKMEGQLELKENAEGGHMHYTLCLDTVVLWSKDDANTVCPSSLNFSLAIPTEFHHEGQSYPLPPSDSTKLEGLPGFSAIIDYSVSTIMDRSHSINISKHGIHIGNTNVSTPFIYYPRTRPPYPIPSPLECTETGNFIERPEWQVYQSMVKAHATTPNGVYLSSFRQFLSHHPLPPASRIFCVSQDIPFHITLESDAHSLATFLPYGPIPNSSRKWPATRVQVMRQSAVDVKSVARSEPANTALWRVDYIGEAAFRHARDGATHMSFSGEIKLEPTKITGFTVPGFSVQDCILLTVSPPEGVKAPFLEVREVLPVRLTTDVWTDAAPASEKGHSM